MATLKVKKDGKEYVVYGGTTDVRFKSADEAFDYMNAEAEKIEAERAKPVSVSVTKRGQITVQPNDREALGNFALLTLTGNGMKALIAAWPEVIRQYEAASAQGKIVAHWKNLPASEKKSKSA